MQKRKRIYLLNPTVIKQQRIHLRVSYSYCWCQAELFFSFQTVETERETNWTKNWSLSVLFLLCVSVVGLERSLTSPYLTIARLWMCFKFSLSNEIEKNSERALESFYVFMRPWTYVNMWTVHTLNGLRPMRVFRRVVYDNSRCMERDTKKNTSKEIDKQTNKCVYGTKSTHGV